MKTESELYDAINKKLPEKYSELAKDIIQLVKENKEVFFAQPEIDEAITNSEKAYRLLRNDMQDLKHEEFWIVTVNRANIPISKIKISQGGLSGTVVDIRLILKKCLEDRAVALIIAHNHPSGSLKISDGDKSVTEKLKNACKLMDIDLLDHIVITSKHYKSFADEGYFLH